MLVLCCPGLPRGRASYLTYTTGWHRRPWRTSSSLSRRTGTRIDRWRPVFNLILTTSHSWCATLNLQQQSPLYGVSPTDFLVGHSSGGDLGHYARHRTSFRQYPRRSVGYTTSARRSSWLLHTTATSALDQEQHRSNGRTFLHSVFENHGFRFTQPRNGRTSTGTLKS